VVVRANVEDLYAGIEHMQMPGVVQCINKHRWMHVEKLQEFGGAAGYTRAQGED